MRTTIAVAAGLAAVASASWEATSEKAADVTVTSCAPTHTNCPYDPETVEWEDWSTSSSADPTTTAETWADWSTSSYADPTTTTETWEDWSTSSYADPTTTTETWEDWSTSSYADPTTTSTYWEDWSATSSYPAAETSSCPAYTSTAPPAWFSYLPSDVKSSIEAKWTGAPPADWCYYTYSTATWATSTPSAETATYSTPVEAASSGVWQYSASPVSPTVATYTGAASSNAGNIVVAGLAAAAALVIA